MSRTKWNPWDLKSDFEKYIDASNTPDMFILDEVKKELTRKFGGYLSAEKVETLLSKKPAEPLSLLPHPTPPAPATPRASHWGFWKGEEGAWLNFDGVSSTSHPNFLNASAHFRRQPTIEITGTAIEQQVHGYGVRTGDNIKIHLLLLGSRRWIDLDLVIIVLAHMHIKLTGTAQNPNGETIPVVLTQVAADLARTWAGDGGTSLSFSKGTLEWNENKRQVRGKAWGSVFGRKGRGEFEFNDERYNFLPHVLVTLHTDDTSHFLRWVKENGAVRGQYGHRVCDVEEMPKWQLDHNYGKSYQKSAPQEVWWGSDSLLLQLDVAADHPYGEWDGLCDRQQVRRRQAPLHLTFVPPQKTYSTKSLL